MALVVMEYGEAGDHESGGETGNDSGDSDRCKCSR